MGSLRQQFNVSNNAMQLEFHGAAFAIPSFFGGIYSQTCGALGGRYRGINLRIGIQTEFPYT